VTDHPSPPPRLADDDLYTWARLVSDIEHAQQAIDRFGKSVLARSGYDPRTATITNDGYIIPTRSGALGDVLEAARNGTD